MNIEVEIKIKIKNFEDVRKKVSAVGRLVKSIRQIDEYYVPCHRNFFTQKPHPTEWLRIRTNPDKVIFEYDRSINKKLSGEQDYAEEYETEISDTGEFRKIERILLQVLGRIGNQERRKSSNKQRLSCFIAGKTEF